MVIRCKGFGVRTKCKRRFLMLTLNSFLRPSIKLKCKRPSCCRCAVDPVSVKTKGYSIRVQLRENQNNICKDDEKCH